MAEHGDLEARMKALEDTESIKKVKAKYWRCIDRKLWGELADCFAVDARADYGPDMKFQSGEAIVKFLKDTLGGENVITVHEGHNPEIEIISASAARATWALNDYIVIQPNTKRMGWGFYEDEYVRVNGVWKIKMTREFSILEEWDMTKG
jgi:hypothetical protein